MNDVSIRGIDIHTYLVKDAPRAIAFWRDAMGLRLIKEWENLGAEFELPDGSTFGLWKLEENEGGWVQGNGVMFAVAEIGAAVDHYRSRGVEIVHVEETPVCFMAFAADTEGNTFVIHQRK
jgi:catechol 2,3-dioxygenase-like lactoylglutathione lyase family enzyme